MWEDLAALCELDGAGGCLRESALVMECRCDLKQRCGELRGESRSVTQKCWERCGCELDTAAVPSTTRA